MMALVDFKRHEIFGEQPDYRAERAADRVHLRRCPGATSTRPAACIARVRCGWRRPATRSCPRTTEGAGEPGVPDGAAPGPHGHAAGHVRRHRSVGHREPVRIRPGLPPGPVPPGSTSRATPRRRSPVRAASTSSRSIWQVMPRGDPDVRDRPALRGGRVPRLLLPLAARPHPRSRAPGAATVHRRGLEDPRGHGELSRVRRTRTIDGATDVPWPFRRKPVEAAAAPRRAVPVAPMPRVAGAPPPLRADGRPDLVPTCRR